MRRVPALFLETVAVVEQDLKSLKVVDIVEKQRRPVSSVRTEGMEAGVRIFGVKPGLARGDFKLNRTATSPLDQRLASPSSSAQTKYFTQFVTLRQERFLST